jgi:hypothetical protein
MPFRGTSAAERKLRKPEVEVTVREEPRVGRERSLPVDTPVSELAKAECENVSACYPTKQTRVVPEESPASEDNEVKQQPTQHHIEVRFYQMHELPPVFLLD